MKKSNEVRLDPQTNDLDILSGPPAYNWNDITYFLELARYAKLVDVAKRLKVDHTTVSRRIRELEKALDCKLFKRTKSGFMLTNDGWQILEHAEAMEKNARTVSHKKGFEQTQGGGAVRVATMEGIGSFYISPKVETFKERYPEIILELVTSSRWINLSRQEADIFISFSKPDEKRLKVKKAGNFRISLFASQAYLNKRGMPSSKSDLNRHDFVDYIDDLIQIHAVRYLHDIIKPRRVVFRSTSQIAQYSSITKGLGIAALPTFVAAQNPDLVPVLPELSTSRDIWLSVHQDLDHVPRIGMVISFFMSEIEKDTSLLLSTS